MKGDDFLKCLFVDMDGTLAVFRKITKIEELYEEGYFENLSPLPGVVRAVKDIIAQGQVKVYILSSVLSDSKYALDEKNRWLDRYLPEIPSEDRFFPACGDSKIEFFNGHIGKDHYLLDDYSKNLHDWDPPGHGIKLSNGINGRFGTWKSHCVSHECPDLANEILSIMNTMVRDNTERER